MPESSDEQDLAKALSDVSATLNTTTGSNSLQFEESQSLTGAMPPPFGNHPISPATQSPPPLLQPLGDTPSPAPTADPISVPAGHVTQSDSPLDSIKQSALLELRPLVDKLNVGPEEKFDTYLLLIRSTDDAALIAPAHEAAKAITDETRRAQALLDIIKEIDFLSQQK